ncbi:MAG: Malate/L-lactate dehydrogenase [Chloroflexi bacterium]|jgi:L-2-hydroxycarboxylate dehydrogenase (NAD+)|nr:Malate/L-lactate dehydrogenase [Chloroflexota bacterium]
MEDLTYLEKITRASAPGMVRVPLQPLLDFVAAFMEKMGLNRADSEKAAEVLVTSDLRGIESHGVPRLDMYLEMFRLDLIQPEAPYTIERESGATALVNGGRGLGLVVGPRAMQLAIDKAQASGVGMVAVTNSSHFGIAGYYAEMALAHDMIGLAFTNASPLGVPTGGREHRVGTNPLAFAAPANQEMPFLLDMATTAVSFGKIEIAARSGRSIPIGWGLDPEGHPTTDPYVALKYRLAAPLGSFPELSSHKGYGLGVMVDILCGVLSGMGYGMRLPRLQAGHFFGALRIDAFRDVTEFKAEMDDMIRELRSTKPVEGVERVYVAGEKEFLAEAVNRQLGVPLLAGVVQRLLELGQELDIPTPGITLE